MRLLVDECCDPRLVATLRSAGYDVRYALESDRGAPDEALFALSVADRRKPELVVALLAQYGEQLRNSLAVLGEFGARLRPLLSAS